MAEITCSICSVPFETEFALHIPFCSRKCQQIDLGRWLNEEYSLPVEGQEDVDVSEDADEQQERLEEQFMQSHLPKESTN